MSQYVHIPSKRIFNDRYSAYKAIYRAETGKAEPESDELLATVQVFPYQPPDIPEGWKRGDVLVNMGVYWTWQVVEKTAEDLLAETYVHSISPRQCRIYLKRAGLLNSIKQMVSQLDEEAQIEWEYALEIKRDHQLVLAMAQALGMNEAAIHAMFYDGSKI